MVKVCVPVVAGGSCVVALGGALISGGAVKVLPAAANVKYVGGAARCSSLAA